jgi:hypothetical protein
LRSTSQFGFAGVPNALNLELNLTRLLEVALVVTSWRVVLHCSQRDAPSPLRLDCCARGRVVLYRSRGETPDPPYSAALCLTAAFGFVVRVSVPCVSWSGETPKTYIPFSLSFFLLFADLPALHDMHEESHHAFILKNPPACDASRLRRLQSSRIALLF